MISLKSFLLRVRLKVKSDDVSLIKSFSFVLGKMKGFIILEAS